MPKEKLHLFHATNNFQNIIRFGKIAVNPKVKRNKMVLKKPSGFIFSQLVFNDIVKYVKTDTLHWIGSCVIELDIDLLKRYEFIICRIGGFDELINKSGKELKTMENVYAYGRGNLKRMPSLKKAKQMIINNVTQQNYIGAYMHSHEVLFKNDIPISLFKRILVYNESVYKKIMTYMKKYKISNVEVVLFPYQARTDTQMFINKLQELDNK